MPRAPRGSVSSRRPRAEADGPRETAGSRSSEAPASTLDRRTTEIPATSVSRQPAVRQEDVTSRLRFRIFIIDSGWNSAAHKVLQENFGLICDLQKEDPIYVLSREQSIEFIRRHQDRIGREPLIAVHDLTAMSESGTTDFHGFRLDLGLMRTPQQALLALQHFVRFVSTHRQSNDLEAEIRTDLRREGLAGAIDIIMHHEAREGGEPLTAPTGPDNRALLNADMVRHSVMEARGRGCRTSCLKPPSALPNRGMCGALILTRPQDPDDRHRLCRRQPVRGAGGRRRASGP